MQSPRDSLKLLWPLGEAGKGSHVRMVFTHFKKVETPHEKLSLCMEPILGRARAETEINTCQGTFP